MWKFITFLVVVLLLLTGFPEGKVSESTSPIATTDTDRQWVFNTSQDLEKINGIQDGIIEAYWHDDYAALNSFGNALIETTSESIEDSKSYNVTVGMVPAKDSWENAMKYLNSAGWNIRIYAQSNGVKENFWTLFKADRDDANDMLRRYSEYK